MDTIKNEGPVTFEKFMDMALYYPELGYYSSPETTIGREGDFYTSPHLHPIFGAMLGTQLMEMWKSLGRPSVFHALEMGAGVGYLSKDILDYLHRPLNDATLKQDREVFLRSLRYVIVEPYGHFREKQKKLLDDAAGIPAPPLPSSRKEMTSIKWITSLEELDNMIHGCIFSNELLDAFPVHMIEMNRGPKEVYVHYEGSRFREITDRLSTDMLSDYLSQFSVCLEDRYRTEVNLRIRDWLSDVSQVISEGFLLTIDYGYSAKEFYDESRSRGTLLCYHKHMLNENPYEKVGKQDITAHVNFSSIMKWGEEFGLKTLGYCPQGTYLIASGIDEVITELFSGSPDYLSEVSKIKGLIMPQGMGESHSVMVQYKGDRIPELRGFSMRNLAGTL